jgi:uncharacterized protein YhaN
MRIRRLDLLRYGRFTDAVLDFSPHSPDLHIVFGPNEAGKSTALSAIEDLLFGIPQNTSLNFVHQYSSMRIGALLQKNGDSLEVRRRKGNKETLLTPDEAVIAGGDGALAPFLGGADQRFFSRMFSLDHLRLRQGGREILEAQDEVGQMLFSVGAGIVGLRDRLKALEKEADGLWASRHAGYRKYYQAEDRLKAAESALREHIVNASKWQELRRAYDTAREKFEKLEEESEAKSVELRKLSRIRRVYRDVRRHGELAAGIAALGTVIPLAEDASETLRGAEQDQANATTRIETLAEQIEKAGAERDLLTYDAGLLLRAEDVKQLQERRIQVRAEKADLPKRRTELATNEVQLRRLAEELEWDASDIDRLVVGIPTRAKVAAVRALLNERSGLLSAVGSGTSALEEAEAKLTEIREELESMGGVPADISKLAALVSATRSMGDIAARISAAGDDAKEAQAAVERSLRSLTPPVADEETLASIPVPPTDTVERHRETRRNLDERQRACSERIRSAEQELVRHEKARERIARTEDAVSPEELSSMREHRDAGWALVRRRYVDGVSVDEEEVRAFTGADSDLVHAYEVAVGDADALADRRFDKTEAAARLVMTSRQIAEQRELLDGLRGEETVLALESQNMDAAWREMWRGAPFEPLTPDAMLEWFATRTAVLDGVGRRTLAERQVATLRREESEAKDRLLAELAVLGVDAGPAKDEPLRVVLEMCAGIQRKHEREADARRRLEESSRKAAADTERKRTALEKAKQAWSAWERRWTEALARLGLRAESEPEAVTAQVNAIDEMRVIAVKVNELRHERIGKIERDLDAFDRDVAEIVGAVAADLAGMPSEEAILQVEARLNDAERIRGLRNEKDKAIASLEKKIGELEESRRKAREIIGNLHEAAGVKTTDDLKAAIARSDRLRVLETELSQVTATIGKDGDGLPIFALEEECAAADIDQVAAREDALGRELKELQNLLLTARDALTDARTNFEAIGGDDAAATDAAARQEALAEIQHVAEQYVRVRSSTILLRWAIDRYRREKQAPILKRAGQLFAALTGNSFSALRVDFDDQDRARLIGIRPNGATVGVPGMSVGTADQLYLALRIASIEDYLDRAAPLPFVADDLFINFDDDRAAAGLRVLSELATRTQVLFFTHHQHLVEIARATLGDSVPAVPLI